MSTFKERARLEEALSSESGQQQLAVRTFKVQLNKQIEQLNALQGQLEQAKREKDEKRQAAFQVRRVSNLADVFHVIRRSNNNSSN